MFLNLPFPILYRSKTIQQASNYSNLMVTLCFSSIYTWKPPSIVAYFYSALKYYQSVLCYNLTIYSLVYVKYDQMTLKKEFDMVLIIIRKYKFTIEYIK